MGLVPFPAVSHRNSLAESRRVKAYYLMPATDTAREVARPAKKQAMYRPLAVWVALARANLEPQADTDGHFDLAGQLDAPDGTAQLGSRFLLKIDDLVGARLMGESATYQWLLARQEAASFSQVPRRKIEQDNHVESPWFTGLNTSKFEPLGVYGFG
jgi:hypothetical protein